MTAKLPPAHAPVVAVTGNQVTVSCPYCGKQHTHIRPGFTPQSNLAWRAPGCGWQRSPQDRARGYLIYFERNTP